MDWGVETGARTDGKKKGSCRALGGSNVGGHKTKSREGMFRGGNFPVKEAEVYEGSWEDA